MGIEDLKKAALAFKQKQAAAAKAQQPQPTLKPTTVKARLTSAEIAAATAAFKGPIKRVAPANVEGLLAVKILRRAEQPLPSGDYIVWFQRMGQAHDLEKIIALADHDIWVSAKPGRTGQIDVRRLQGNELWNNNHENAPTMRIMTALKALPQLSAKHVPEGPKEP